MSKYSKERLAAINQRLVKREAVVSESVNIRLGNTNMSLDTYKMILRNQYQGNVRKLCRAYRITERQHDIAMACAVAKARRVKEGITDG